MDITPLPELFEKILEFCLLPCTAAYQFCGMCPPARPACHFERFAFATTIVKCEFVTSWYFACFSSAHLQGGETEVSKETKVNWAVALHGGTLTLFRMSFLPCKMDVEIGLIYIYHHIAFSSGLHELLAKLFAGFVVLHCIHFGWFPVHCFECIAASVEFVWNALLGDVHLKCLLNRLSQFSLS